MNVFWTTNDGTLCVTERFFGLSTVTCEPVGVFWLGVTVAVFALLVRGLLAWLDRRNG